MNTITEQIKTVNPLSCTLLFIYLVNSMHSGQIAGLSQGSHTVKHMHTCQQFSVWSADTKFDQVYICILCVFIFLTKLCSVVCE